MEAQKEYEQMEAQKEYEQMRAARTRRMERSQTMFDEAMKEAPFETRPLPWTARQVIHDGPGWQFFDADGKPVLTELLREPEDTAWLLRFVNSFVTDDRFIRYHAFKTLLLAARRLDTTMSADPEFQELTDFRKALEAYAGEWKDET